MVPPLEESEDGDRASFSRWEKRSVISYHFTKLVLEITKMEMLPFWNYLSSVGKITGAVRDAQRFILDSYFNFFKFPV